MIIRLCYFTPRGYEIADKLKNTLTDDIVLIKDTNDSTDDFVRDSFMTNTPLVFIGACGIAVRKIAPYVKDKLTDPPVLVVDELGRYVIPILSGHVGGANLLAAKISDAIGSEAVITTATDAEGLFAVDVFAADKGLKIVNRDGIKKVSGRLLSEGKITLCIEDECMESVGIGESDFPESVKLNPYPPRDNVDVLIAYDDAYDNMAGLVLRPKRYALGIGCKLGTTADAILKKVEEAAANLGITTDELLDNAYAVATIDLKIKERGLWEFANINRLRMLFYSSDELASAEGVFSESDFVKNITGVSNVCERAAVMAAGKGKAKLAVGKISGEGVTVAVSVR